MIYACRLRNEYGSHKRKQDDRLNKGILHAVTDVAADSFDGLHSVDLFCLNRKGGRNRRRYLVNSIQIYSDCMFRN